MNINRYGLVAALTIPVAAPARYFVGLTVISIGDRD